MRVFEKIDEIRAQVDRHRIEPLFSNELFALTSRYEQTIAAEGNNLLRVMAKLIAYSNNAPSDKVTQLLDAGHFERAFHGFDLDAVATADPQCILENHWPAIGAIRFKKKVGYIVACAKVLRAHGKEGATIDSIYKQHVLPICLNKDGDVDVFWHKFDHILAGYQREGMPYFKNMTTLLHLLLHIGFPCVKPDLIVMRTAAQLGIVPARENHNQYRPHERRLAVRTIQEYGVKAGISPAVIDLYLLIHGGQRYSMKFVDAGYVPAKV